VPARFLDDSTPVIQFDTALEISPYHVFRRLIESDPPLLVDVRVEVGARTLAGAIPYPGPEWSPPRDQDVVLFDDNGALAVDGARHMQAAGWSNVKALFGGLDLWEFALDPQVVGAETFLRRGTS
jgi:rhodanese-related sulfurtransferase